MAINFGLLAAATVSFGAYWLCWECLKLRSKGKLKSGHCYGFCVLLMSILTLVTPILFSLVAVDLNQPWYFGGGPFGLVYLWTQLRYIWFGNKEKK